MDIVANLLTQLYTRIRGAPPTPPPGAHLFSCTPGPHASWCRYHATTPFEPSFDSLAAACLVCGARSAGAGEGGAQGTPR
jgi:hypothetical protein